MYQESTAILTPIGMTDSHIGKQQPTLEKIGEITNDLLFAHEGKCAIAQLEKEVCDIVQTPFGTDSESFLLFLSRLGFSVDASYVYDWYALRDRDTASGLVIPKPQVCKILRAILALHGDKMNVKELGKDFYARTGLTVQAATGEQLRQFLNSNNFMVVNDVVFPLKILEPPPHAIKLLEKHLPRKDTGIGMESTMESEKLEEISYDDQEALTKMLSDMTTGSPPKPHENRQELNSASAIIASVTDSVLTGEDARPSGNGKRSSLLQGIIPLESPEPTVSTNEDTTEEPQETLAELEEGYKSDVDEEGSVLEDVSSLNVEHDNAKANSPNQPRLKPSLSVQLPPPPLQQHPIKRPVASSQTLFAVSPAPGANSSITGKHIHQSQILYMYAVLANARACCT